LITPQSPLHGSDRVTYSKPETKVNHSTSYIKQILALGLNSLEQQNWSSVNHQLRLLASITLTENDWQTSFKLALRVLLDGDFQDKWEVAKIFPLLGTKIVRPLIVILKDEETEIEVKWFICRILGNFSEPEVIIALIELLQQTDPELATIASQTLTEIGSAAINALVQLLPQTEYRLLAVKSLACIRRSEIITPLIGVVDDPQAEIRTLAIEALGSFHERRIAPILIAALRDTASSVRREAAIALGFRQDLSAELDLVTHLQPLLYDLNLEVCRQSAIALSRLQAPSAVTALFEVLQSIPTPLELKLELVRALGRSELESAIDYLGQTLAIAPELLSQEIIAVLGRIFSPQLRNKATNILLDFCNSPNRLNSPQTKQILALSLGELKNSAAKPYLSQLAADDDQIVRLHAIAALKKLPT
jgi:HEAT repeat protein